MKTKILRQSWLLLILLLLITACTVQPTPTLAPTAAPTAAKPKAQSTFTDPYQYCASVGTIDRPDARYSGEAVPDAIIQGFITAAGLQNSTEPKEMFKKTTIWRCMEKQVYACNFGANLPCDSKANTSKTPTQGMTDFCKANPNAEFLPAAVTGHDTVYSWRCVKDTPEVIKQISPIDASGYIANIWYKLAPAP